jgi:broad specificity phosphatase PhoE
MGWKATDMPGVWLVRHGETEWSKAGRHTGHTDIGLTATGQQQARRLGRQLRHHRFALVLSSPMGRALETARLAGFRDRAQTDRDLSEWDYGAYEGISTAEIRRTVPGWTIWTHPVPDGEAIDAVGVRADRVIVRIRAAKGDVIVFGHGHLLRVLAARWIGLPPSTGRRLALGTATLSVLGWERETPVIERWNVETGPLRQDDRRRGSRGDVPSAPPRRPQGARGARAAR